MHQVRPTFHILCINFSLHWFRCARQICIPINSCKKIIYLQLLYNVLIYQNKMNINSLNEIFEHLDFDKLFMFGIKSPAERSSKFFKFSSVNHNQVQFLINFRAKTNCRYNFLCSGKYSQSSSSTYTFNN